MMRLGLSVGLVGLLVGCSRTETVPSSGEGALETRAGVCSAEQQLAAFQQMIAAPILPPRKLAGIDLAGGDHWPGLTLDGAQQTLCQGTDLTKPESATAQTGTLGWGLAPNHQLTLDYDKTTKRVTAWALGRGYQGSLEFASRPSAPWDPSTPNPFGKHTYSIGIGREILRDGRPWPIAWKRRCLQVPSQPDCLQSQATELFDAIMYTFAPDLPSSQDNCVAAGTCLASAPGTMGIFGVRALGVYFYVNDTAAAPAVPESIYGFVTKTMPFSGADLTLRLDQGGPVAAIGRLGDRRVDCTMSLGTTYASFLSGCVRISRDENMNDAIERKLLGNLQRTTTSGAPDPSGTWLFDVSGTNLNFRSERSDEAKPTASAPATELVLDVRSNGKVLNDRDPAGRLTLAATGAIYREYGRLVHTHALEMAGIPASLQRPYGDPACRTGAPPVGCTGMENFVSPAEPSTTADPNLQALSVGADNGSALGIRTALKPGDPIAAFCARNDTPGDFSTCWSEGGGRNGPLFSTTKDALTAVIGAGHEDALPPALRSLDTYAKLWGRAVVRYLLATQQAPADLSMVAEPLETDFTVEPVRADMVKVRYQSRFEMTVLLNSTNVQEMVFR